MKTEEQVKEEFLTKLKALLAEFGEGTELEADDYYTGYSECGRDVHMTLSTQNKWDEDGNQIQEFYEIDIGSLIYSD